MILNANKYYSRVRAQIREKAPCLYVEDNCLLYPPSDDILRILREDQRIIFFSKSEDDDIKTKFKFRGIKYIRLDDLAARIASVNDNVGRSKNHRKIGDVYALFVGLFSSIDSVKFYLFSDAVIIEYSQANTQQRSSIEDEIRKQADHIAGIKVQYWDGYTRIAISHNYYPGIDEKNSCKYMTSKKFIPIIVSTSLQENSVVGGLRDKYIWISVGSQNCDADFQLHDEPAVEEFLSRLGSDYSCPGTAGVWSFA